MLMEGVEKGWEEVEDVVMEALQFAFCFFLVVADHQYLFAKFVEI